MIIFCNIRHLAHFIFCWDLKNKIGRQIYCHFIFIFFPKLCLRVSSYPGSNKGFANIKEIDFPRCCGWDAEQQINACLKKCTPLQTHSVWSSVLQHILACFVETKEHSHCTTCPGWCIESLDATMFWWGQAQNLSQWFQLEMSMFLWKSALHRKTSESCSRLPRCLLSRQHETLHMQMPCTISANIKKMKSE